MGKRTLVDADIDAGRELLRALDSSKFEVDAALWLYSSDSDQWRLILASPVAHKAPRVAYQQIQAVLNGLPASRLALDDISVVSPQDDLIRLLMSAVVSDDGEMRLSRSTINGVFIDDAYIYRVRRGRSLSRR